MTQLESVFELIERECRRQQAKWGIQTHSTLKWLAILTEEVGEVAMAILEGDIEQMHTELIQCAAVIVSWLCNGDTRGK